MLARRLFGFALCIAFLIPNALFAADAPTADVLKDKGLVKSGNNFALSDETEVLASMKTLAVTKKSSDKELRARQIAESKIAAKGKTIRDSEREWEQLEARLPLVKDVKIHNGIVTRMNGLVATIKTATITKKDLEDDARKLSSENQMKFVDDLLELSPKFDAINAKYDALASDADMKAALAKFNSASLASSKATVGPSPEFTAASADIKKWQSAVDSQSIPMREEGGVHSVDVVLAGMEHVMMVVDTGASYVTLPYDMAVKLKIEPKEQDPSVKMQLADGNLIDGKMVNLKSVRVGRFTVENVSCVVLQKGLAAPPLILGVSFLEHFVVKLNQKAGELYLTEIKDEKSVGSGSKSSAADAPEKPLPRKPTGADSSKK